MSRAFNRTKVAYVSIAVQKKTYNGAFTWVLSRPWENVQQTKTD